MFEVFGVLLIVVLYLLYRFWPNQLAEEMKRDVFENVDDSVLEKYARINLLRKKLSGRSDRSGLDFVWEGWINYDDGCLDIVMRVLGGYGGIFMRAVEMRRFYFREILREFDNVDLVRRWLRDAMTIGIIRMGEDRHGVTYYFFDKEKFGEMIKYIDDAIGELL
ncbi:MAG: hypothetical protein Q6363_000410 [Candidatus Njordarchaeota archaeon]